MADPRDEVLSLLREHGAEFVRFSKRGGGLYLVLDQRLVIPGPVTERRAWNNCLSDLRKIIRNATQETPPMDEPQTNDDPLRDYSPALDLETLGVYRETSAQTRVVRTDRAVVPASAIAQLLGVGLPEGAVLSLEDGTGAKVEGPLTLTVVSESVQ